MRIRILYKSTVGTVPVSGEVKVSEAVFNLLGCALSLELNLTRVLLQAVKPPTQPRDKFGKRLRKIK
jgi:hypothetical protein